MSKRILLVVMALAFVLGLSGMALARNLANVDQTADNDNDAYINQVGGGSSNNVIDIYQGGSDRSGRTSSYSDATVYQNGNGNDVGVHQEADGFNYLYVDQNGSYNVLAGLTLGVPFASIVDINQNALQLSDYGKNDLIVVQHGDSNKAGLYQSAYGNNYANISQTGGGDLLVAWQNAPWGSNTLNVTQSSPNALANVAQNAINGNNVATITQ